MEYERKLFDLVSPGLTAQFSGQLKDQLESAGETAAAAASAGYISCSLLGNTSKNGERLTHTNKIFLMKLKC